jgi:hypothetical protein
MDFAMSTEPKVVIVTGEVLHIDDGQHAGHW